VRAAPGLRSAHRSVAAQLRGSKLSDEGNRRNVDVMASCPLRPRRACAPGCPAACPRRVASRWRRRSRLDQFQTVKIDDLLLSGTEPARSQAAFEECAFQGTGPWPSRVEEVRDHQVAAGGKPVPDGGDPFRMLRVVEVVQDAGGQHCERLTFVDAAAAGWVVKIEAGWRASAVMTTVVSLSASSARACASARPVRRVTHCLSSIRESITKPPTRLRRLPGCGGLGTRGTKAWASLRSRDVEVVV